MIMSWMIFQFYCQKTKIKFLLALLFIWQNDFPAAAAEDEIKKLDEEVIDYIQAPSSTLPSLSTEEKSLQLCRYWQEMGKLKMINGTPRFLLLTKLVLSLSHSNAHTARVFSMVRKITTEYRSEMEQKTLHVPW